MTRKEFTRRAHQSTILESLGFTSEEAEKLRKISMTLQRWHELECGTGEGSVSVSVERDDSGKPWRRVQFPTSAGYVDKRFPVRDAETGALRRLQAIINQRNARITNPHSKDAELNIHAACKARLSGFVSAYIQGDPRGAALYILRPGDVPEGQDAGAFYSRGIVVY